MTVKPGRRRPWAEAWHKDKPPLARICRRWFGRAVAENSTRRRQFDLVWPFAGEVVQSNRHRARFRVDRHRPEELVAVARRPVPLESFRNAVELRLWPEGRVERVRAE